MEIILKEDIIGVGYKNDIVTVKDGYGRNFLIPKGKAIIASESARKVLAENLRQQARKLEAIKAEAQKKADTLKDVELVIPAKVSSNGATYGSVNTSIVAGELKKKGFEIDRRLIIMRDIKKIGEYEAVVRFHKEVEARVPVKVVDENPAPEKKAEPKTMKPAEAPATTEEEAVVE